MVATEAAVWAVLLCKVLPVETNLKDIHKHSEVRGSRSGGLEPRIFNGQLATENQFPFMVLLLAILNDGELVRLCSASYIRPIWIVTAAHCIVEEKDTTAIDPDQVFAFSGQADMEALVTGYNTTNLPKEIQKRTVKSVHAHPEYEDVVGVLLNYDIALIELEEQFEKPVEVIHLAEERSRILYNCTIVGWGKTGEGSADGKLRYASGLTFIALDEGCVVDDPDLTDICFSMEKSGALQGDSGGPAICDGLVYGIGSIILLPLKIQEGYYTEVPRLRAWINGIIDISSTMKPNTLLVVLIALLMV